MLIYNAKVVTWEKPNQIHDNYAVYIQGNLIKEIGPSSELLKKYPAEDKIDADEQLLMPGSICAHTHFYGAYSRGMGIPGVPSKDFPENLENLWFKLDRSLDEESTRLSAQIFAIDAIKAGCTTLFDHHASPEFIDGSLDVIADVIDKSGLRASLCYEVTDRNGKNGTKAGIRENVRFLTSLKAGKNLGGRLAGAFGIHACLTVDEETLEDCAAAIPDGFGFHIHLAESQEDEWDSLYRFGARCGQRLYQHHILGDRTIVAHAVHVDAREMELLKETGTWISHQPRSNMNNAVGAAQVESMLADGMKVCLGNDGFTFDMWSEWKTAYFLQKVIHRDPRRMNGYDVQEMAIYNNAKLAGQAFGFGDQFGTITVNAPADLILVDYKPFTDLNPGNIPWHIIFGFREAMITTTIVDGKVLMLNRELTTMDEKAICARSREKCPEVWRRFNELHGVK
jgi:putative selenium metabolism protein SsnA